MEIQQQEKESLAACIHQFKTEAKRCNFTNDATIIRIFIKGLENTHSLAICIYEKGPQTLSDTISKVEKLNAVQQMTTMIIPPFTANMSNDEDHCFQCQEQGHIARNYPNIRCFKCDEHGHIVMDCPHRIPPLGTPAKHHQPRLHKNCYARSSSRHHHEDRDRQCHSRSQSHFTDTAVQVIMTYIESNPGHDTGIIATTPEVAYDAHVPHTKNTAIDPTVTHHIDPTTHHPHTEVPQPTTPEIEVDPTHVHPTNSSGEICTGGIHIPADHKPNHTKRRTLQ